MQSIKTLIQHIETAINGLFVEEISKANGESPINLILPLSRK